MTCRGFVTFLQNQKVPFETLDLRLATYDLWLSLHAWISSPYSYIWQGASPLALQPVEDAGLTLSPCVAHQLWRQVNSSHLQTPLQAHWRTGGRLKFIVVFKIKTLNIMTLPFVGFTSQKRPLKFLTCDLLLATCDFPLHAWISSPHSYIWKGASPLALQPVEDAGLALSPRVVHQL